MTEQKLRSILSENIREHRRHHNWSQVILSRKAGVSVNFINDIESKKKWASPATMIKIANAFNVQVYELLKPPGLPPDNMSSIVKKYTADVHAALEHINRTFLREIEEPSAVTETSDKTSDFS